MSTYCVTFRIADKTVSGKSYDDRYRQFMKDVKDGGGFWFDPTSFLLVESHRSTPDYAKKAVQALSEVHDMAFIFDPEDMSACYFGNVEDLKVLKSFFPGAKKVG